MFQFSQQINPIFPVTTVVTAPKPQKMVIVEAPFIEELSGMAMENFRHEIANHKHDKIEVHQK